MIRILKFIPIHLTLFLILGILFGSYYNFQPNTIALVISVLLFILFVVYFISIKQFAPSNLFGILALALSFFIGSSAATFNKDHNHKNHFTNNPKFIANKPVSALISIRKVLKSNLFYNKYEATVLQLNGARTTGNILVNIEKDSLENALHVDDKLVIKKVFRKIKKPSNPYMFDYRKYLQKKQIHYQVYIEVSQYLKVLNSKRTIRGIASKLRGNINKSLVKYGFKDNELAIINALLLGQRQTISNDLQQRYAGAGVIHILAVSGLHIGIILLLLSYLLQPFHVLKHGKLITSILIVTILWGYAIIAGLSASVVRAVSMFSAIAIGIYLNRPSNLYNTLVLSMFFLLLLNPYFLFEVGFELSYLAVFSIVWIQPKLQVLWKPKYWVVNKFWKLFTVSLAAQIGVLPLSLYYFHQFPGLFFLSNLVIIPFLGFLLFAGFLIISLSVFQLLPQFMAESFNLTIQYLNHFVTWISNQESFIIRDISFSFAMMIACYAFIVLFFKWVEKRLFSRIVLLLISVITIQSVHLYEKFSRASTKEFIVFNKSKSSLIGIRNGYDLYISSSADSLDIHGNILKSYIIGSGISDRLHNINFNSLFTVHEEVIFVVDSLGIYNIKSVKPTIFLLQNSPKINLERLIVTFRPKLIIADGSSFRSYVDRWEQTCLKNKTPFYNTMKKGAFILKEKINYY